MKLYDAAEVMVDIGFTGEWSSFSKGRRRQPVQCPPARPENEPK
jgi:hypothetical protein